MSHINKSFVFSLFFLDTFFLAPITPNARTANFRKNAHLQNQLCSSSCGYGILTILTFTLLRSLYVTPSYCFYGSCGEEFQSSWKRSELCCLLLSILGGEFHSCAAQKVARNSQDLCDVMRDGRSTFVQCLLILLPYFPPKPNQTKNQNNQPKYKNNHPNKTTISIIIV